MSTGKNKADLDKIFEIIMSFGREKNYFNLLKIILVKMMDITNADAGTLYILEDEKLHFRIIRTISMNVFKSAEEKIDLPPIQLDEHNISNVSAYSAIKNEIVTIDDVYNDHRFNFDGPKKYDQITGYHTCSMLVLPLTATNNGEAEVIGVIQLINATDKETGVIKPFGDVHNPPILPSLANIAANTLSNILYAYEIKGLFNSFVRVMTKAIDERSPYNTNHTRKVAMYCEKLASYLSGKYETGHPYHFSESRTEKLVMAAFLHDIGKIITPLNIMDKPDRLGEQLDIIRLKFEIKKQQVENEYLKKAIDNEQYHSIMSALDDALTLIEESNTAGFLPDGKIDSIKKLDGLTYFDKSGKELAVLTEQNLESLSVQKGTLTETERKIMQEHVSVTGRLLEEMAFNQRYNDVPLWARSHHEFLDGSGYPLGLKGDEITLETAVITLTDIYDALTANDRPYKKAVPAQKALEILKSMADEGKLHKDMVTHFIESGIWDTH